MHGHSATGHQTNNGAGGPQTIGFDPVGGLIGSIFHFVFRSYGFSKIFPCGSGQPLGVLNAEFRFVMLIFPRFRRFLISCLAVTMPAIHSPEIELIEIISKRLLLKFTYE
jgi:hypothetical protein